MERKRGAVLKRSRMAPFKSASSLGETDEGERFRRKRNSQSGGDQKKNGADVGGRTKGLIICKTRKTKMRVRREKRKHREEKSNAIRRKDGPGTMDNP